MSKVITFGEIMLRLAPEGFLRFVQADSFGVTYSGAEANVAADLAGFGVDSAFVTNLPDNEIGQSALNFLRRFGVNTDFINRKSGRLGIYFLEKGASQRPSKVIYDRKDSVIALAQQSDFDWNAIFNGAEVFMFSGITPALSDGTAEICKQACKAARKLGLTVVCDMNYRKKLWNKEKAGKVMAELCQYVDVCLTNEEDASVLFDISLPQKNLTSGVLNKEGYVQVAKDLSKKFSFKKIGITLRQSISATVNRWSGLIFDCINQNAEFSREYEIQIVDRVGAGDSFTAALIYSMLQKFSDKDAVEFCAAASCLKHSVEGDFNQVSAEEVMNLVKGNGSGRVQR